MTSNYSGFYNIVGDNFNIEAVCPFYLPESQCTFTWYRDEEGVAIVSGYDPEEDRATDWLCHCGYFETAGGRCSACGNEPPWGAEDEYDDEYEGVDFELEFSHWVDWDVDSL